MWEDEIVDEIHRIRAERAAKFNYDIDAMFHDIQESQWKSGRKIVSFADGKYVVLQEASTPIESKVA